MEKLNDVQQAKIKFRKRNRHYHCLNSTCNRIISKKEFYHFNGLCQECFINLTISS